MDQDPIMSFRTYDDLDETSTIKKLIDTTWVSALSIYDAASDKRKAIKSKSIGLMDVTMHDSTHLYVIACSGTGQDDFDFGKETALAKIWGRSGDASQSTCVSKIEEAIRADGETSQLHFYVAPVESSAQCYRFVPSTTFTQDQNEKFWEAIRNRLLIILNQLRGRLKLRDRIMESVFGVKFNSDKLPDKDFNFLVEWFQKLINNPQKIDALEKFITMAKKSRKEIISEFCDKHQSFFSKFGYCSKKAKLLLDTATDPCPRDFYELTMRCEILGLRYLEKYFNSDDSTKDQILQVCQQVCLNVSRIADYFAQCAEDNATIALMEYLDKNRSKTVESVDWYCTAIPKEQGATEEIWKDKDPCGLCNIRFWERLKWLLKNPQKDKEDDTKKPQVSSNIEIKETRNADTITIQVTFRDKVHVYMVECNMDTAVAAAEGAIGPWGSNLLNTLADLVERDRDYLTQLETNDTKKSCPSEYLTNVIRCYRYFAWWASNIHGNAILKDINGPHLCFTSHEPVVIVGQIISEDSPLLMQAWVLGPALSAGNTVVLKPPQRGSLSMLHVASLIEKAGFPPGVVSIVPGDAVDIVPGDAVDKVVFMGSKVVGLQVLELQEAGVGQKKVTLMQELRLNGPIIIFVFDGADLTKAVEEIFFANLLIFYDHQHPPRIYVENTIRNDKSLERIKKSSRFQGYVFKDTVDGIAQAAKNDPSYCFAAIYTNDMKKATTMANGIHAGTICINCFDAFYAQTLKMENVLQEAVH